jgi:hypothetical protein
MSRSAKRLRAWRAGRPRCCRSRAETLAPFQGSTHRALTRPAARSRLARTVRPLARGRRPVDARTGKIASPADGGRPGIGCRGNPAIMRRASHRVLTPRTHPTTRRLSRPPCPPCGDDRRRPDVGDCDSGRRGRDVPRLGVAGGSRRWAIRWAKPAASGRIRPVAGRVRSRLFWLICRHFGTYMGDERHASHARGRWFETTRAHQKAP